MGVTLSLPWTDRQGRFSWLPFAGGWTRHRELPAPETRTFRQQWRQREALKQGGAA